jgi:glucose/arabinose dehydrogenase
VKPLKDLAMTLMNRLRVWIVGGLLALAAPWLAAIELTPVLSGLSSPVLATHAGDGTRRQFIVEQTGKIRVLQPGASVPTTFLDIAALLPPPGGERGLLGLAFHPQYAGNGRFFVFYTRSGDGALVTSEYRVSADPNVADTTGKPLLTIPHPTNTNHNGGMLAFGPDGFLYIAVGDGGGSNDTPNNAQNIQSLLGKILRIDVDRADTVAGTLYASPPDNPYVGR